MTMEIQPFEDVSSVKNGDFPASHVSFRWGMLRRGPSHDGLQEDESKFGQSVMAT